MRVGSLHSGFSLLQLTSAAKNFASVEESMEESVKKSGKTENGEIFIFKEWWAPKQSNPEDVLRGFRHVRVVVFEIAGKDKSLAKGRAFDVSYYKRDEQGNPATPTAADQVIDKYGHPAVTLYMSQSDETWYANRYRQGRHLVEISTKNTYRLVARNPPDFKNVEELYEALRKRGISPLLCSHAPKDLTFLLQKARTFLSDLKVEMSGFEV